MLPMQGSKNITVTWKVVTGGTLRSKVTEPNNRKKIVFTDNTSTVPGRGPVLLFRFTQVVTVTGNTQGLTSGKLASFADSTNAVYEP